MGKKESSIENLIFVIILVCVLVFFIIWIIIDDTSKPDYKITINECHNETCSEQQNLFCKVSCVYGLATALEPLEKGITTENQRTNMLSKCEGFCDEKSPIQEVCTEKEVDEIYLITLEQCIEEVKDCYMKGDIPIPLQDCIEQVDCKKISKKDLTKEWLGDNCKFIFTEPSKDTGEYKKGCGYDNNNGQYVCMLDKVKYKCGDYTVEVLK